MTAKAKTKLTNGLLSCSVVLHSAANEDKLKLDSICSCRGKPKSLGLKCSECTNTFGNVKDPPLYGWPPRPQKHKGKWDYDVVISKEDAANLVEEENSTIEVGKFVTLDDLEDNFAVINTEFLMPDEGIKDPASLKLYFAYVKKLSDSNLCLLAKFAQRGKIRRYAITGSKRRKILIAREIVDLKSLPSEVIPVEVSPMEMEFVDKQFESLIAKDTDFPAPEDKLFEHILKQKKIGKSVKKDVDEKMRAEAPTISVSTIEKEVKPKKKVVKKNN